MAKSPRAIFKIIRLAADNWQISAERPGAEAVLIEGLISKADVDDWISGPRRIAWLRSNGYAK